MEINATEFKAKCLKLMDEVAKTRQSLIVTKYGKPIAKVVPIEPEEAKSWYGYMESTIKITGDIMAPMEGEDWEAALGEEAHFYKGMGVAEKQQNEDEK